jgi:hypothetical protein
MLPTPRGGGPGSGADVCDAIVDAPSLRQRQRARGRRRAGPLTRVGPHARGCNPAIGQRLALICKEPRHVEERTGCPLGAGHVSLAVSQYFPVRASVVAYSAVLAAFGEHVMTLRSLSFRVQPVMGFARIPPIPIAPTLAQPTAKLLEIGGSWCRARPGQSDARPISSDMAASTACVGTRALVSPTLPLRTATLRRGQTRRAPRRCGTGGSRWSRPWALPRRDLLRVRLATTCPATAKRTECCTSCASCRSHQLLKCSSVLLSWVSTTTMALAAPAACNSRALFDCLAGGPREAWPGHHLNLELPLKRCEETHRFLARDVSIAGLQCVSDGDSSSFVAPFYDAVRERGCPLDTT